MVTLITGGEGILGTELKKRYPHALSSSHKELDISNQNAVFEYFKKN